MDIQVYRNFITIVEEGSLTAAAKKLLIAQPALSNQLKVLEQEYGSILLSRGARKVSLTDAGRIFYEKAKHIDALEASARQEVADCVRGQLGTLRLGITFSNSVSLFDGLLLEFRKNNPHIRYQLYETESYKIIELVKNGVIEVGIVRGPFQDSGDLDIINEGIEHFVAVYGKCGPWLPPAGDSVCLQDLRDIPLCTIRRFEPLLTAACTRLGFSPHLVCVNSQLMTDIIWAKNGMGVAVVPRSTYEAHRDDSVAYRPIREDTLITTRSIITMRGRYLSAVAQHFLDCCRWAEKIEKSRA